MSPLLGPFPALTPTRPMYVAEMRGATAEFLYGDGSVPVFNATVAEADVYWRLVLATGNGSYVDEKAPEQWRDLALLGWGLGIGKVVGDTFREGPVIGVAYNIADVALNPGINLRFTPDRVQVSHPESARIRRQQDLGVVCSWCVSGKSLSFGLDPLFRDINQTEEVPLVSYGGWLRGNYRESSFSSEISLGTWDWNVRVRQGRTVRVGEVFGDMSLGSREYDPEHPHRDPVPATFAVGMGWQSSAAQVRLVSQLDLRSLEQTWMLSVTLLDRHSWFLCGYPAMGQYCSSR